MMSANRTLRIGLVGCGQIADAHLGELGKIPAADIVATCDSYRDLAEQAAARFNVPAYFDSMDEMFRQTRPDVVHITTPPHAQGPDARGAERRRMCASRSRSRSIPLKQT
ncbi:MAG: Gfo/Idh/MocA family oxidoreductase [Vicinamibacterales bacterium]